MSDMVTLRLPSTPALFAPGGEEARRYWEFFAVHIRNRHTRRAYLGCVERFAAWCERAGLHGAGEVRALHVAAYIEQLCGVVSAPTVKQHLAALRMLFDWLVTGGLLGVNPAQAVRGPRYSAKRGKTAVLTGGEARALLNGVGVDEELGPRDRALMLLMLYTFARVGAVVGMNREDVYRQGGRLWVRLHEKGGKRHELPCHAELAAGLQAYLTERPEGAGGEALFRSVRGRRMTQPDVYLMVQRRAVAAGLETRICCHSFRATGITAYLKNGGRLEMAQQMANHESARTTGLYDRRGDEIAVEELDRIAI